MLMLNPSLFSLGWFFRISSANRSSVARSRNHGDGRDEDPPDQSSLAEFMLEMERNKHESNRLLARIEANTSHQHKEFVSIHDFIGLKPPTFRHSIGPLDADGWLRTVTIKLHSANVAEGDKVTYAAYHLEGPASIWWQNYEAMLPAGQITTWRDFTEAFREHHIPQALIDCKREEFCSFTQSKMAVDAYSREFENLARYATEEVSTDAKKQARFRKGLNPKLRRDLHLHHCNTFQALVNKAINAETAQLTYEESRKHTRDLGSSSGSTSQKRRIWVPNSALPAGYTPRPSCVAPHPIQLHAPPRPIGRPLVKAGPRPTSRTCFTCGDPGHYARDCSQTKYAPPRLRSLLAVVSHHAR